MTGRLFHVSLILLFSLTACGGGSSSSELPAAVADQGVAVVPEIPDISPSAASAAGVWQDTLRAPDFSGAIVVGFKRNSGIRLNPKKEGGPFATTAGVDLSALNSRLSRLPGVEVARILPHLTPGEVEQVRVKVKRERGVDLHDWNLVYSVKVASGAIGEAVLQILYDEPLVDYAYPVPKIIPTGLTIPGISPRQDYLDNGPGGLNIIAGWNAGLTGADQLIIDFEGNWNYDHEDLPLDVNTTPYGPPFSDPDFLSFNHGTAVVGILAALDNGIGVTGISPAATIRTDVPTITGFAGPLEALFFDLQFHDLGGSTVGGQVVLIEAAYGGPQSGSCTEGEQCGTVPIESFRADFDAIADLVNMGVVVVEGAGNGWNSLDDPAQRQPFNNAPDLAVEDSGAIMVGASTGPSMAKAEWSTCGHRINVFAWGGGVVTAGYGDHPITNVNDQNQWYTAAFGGTSAASAQIAGMAALLQEYAAQVTPHEVWQAVHLNGAQTRALMVQSGTPPSDNPSCPIGVQPDLGAAMALLDNGTVVPSVVTIGGMCDNSLSTSCASTCETDPLDPQANCAAICDYAPGHPLCAKWCMAAHKFSPSLCPSYRPLGRFMDLDGDHRADLVAFGKDQQWHVDLSTVNPTGSPDGFGQWDLTIALPAKLTGRLFPVVQDYNTDDRSDLALYNTDTGHWYVSYTTDALIAGDVSTLTWDLDLNYSTDPRWQVGSRPWAGDMDRERLIINRNDGTVTLGQTTDFVLVSPTGEWLFDYQMEDRSSLGVLEQGTTILTAEQIAAAPGWAYLPIIYQGSGIGPNVAYKAPDGVSDAGQLYDFGTPGTRLDTDTAFVYPPIFGGNENRLISDFYLGEFSPVNLGGYSIFTPTGTWENIDFFGLVTFALAPTTGYGDNQCKPVAADFDGDENSDRATLCPGGEWRISYTGDSFPKDAQGFRIVTVADPGLAVPGQVYPGGVAYQTIKEIYSHFNFGCTGPEAANCTIFDLPAPIGPYFADCLTRWGQSPLSCLKQ